MNGIPLQTILLPILGLGLVFYMLRRQKQMIADGDTQYAKFRLDQVAPRMQLAIVEGGPDFNLMMAHAHHGQKQYDPKGGVLGQLSGEGMKESRAVLRGAPTGAPRSCSITAARTSTARCSGARRRSASSVA